MIRRMQAARTNTLMDFACLEGAFPWEGAALPYSREGGELVGRTILLG